MSLRLCLTEEILPEHPVIAAVAEGVTEIVVVFTPAERYGWCLCSVRDFLYAGTAARMILSFAGEISASSLKGSSCNAQGIRCHSTQNICA
jgi:hypothetical protein